MIVVAIIGILAAVAIPKFADMLRKSHEGTGKGNMAPVRSALAIYYGDMQGIYPDDISSLTSNSKYLAAIPLAKTPPYHVDASWAHDGNVSQFSDGGEWQYDNNAADGNYGSIWVDCFHT